MKTPYKCITHCYWIYRKSLSSVKHFFAPSSLIRDCTKKCRTFHALKQFLSPNVNYSEFSLKYMLLLITKGLRKCYKQITFTLTKISVLGVLGKVSTNPGNSCKDIMERGATTGDGEYWIDPQKNGDPLKVYCDMTTDGGKQIINALYVLTPCILLYSQNVKALKSLHYINTMPNPESSRTFDGMWEK